jgi:hypothetical protein
VVERLYAVFGRVPRPERVEGCPHCVAPDEDRPLLEGPVRSLEPAVLERYAAKALTTWGGVAEFRYFLPRLLECAAADAFVHPDPQIVFGKLATAGWRRWPAEERAAVTEFLTAWWDATLARHPVRPDAATVLCCLAATGADLDPFLDRWAALDGLAAVRHLHAFVYEEVRWTARVRLGGFWDVRGAARVLAWLTGGAAAEAVRRAFEVETGEEALELLADLDPMPA